MQTFTSITIRYTALDAAGNVAYCTFNITLEGSTCVTIAHPKNGMAAKLGFFLQLRCNPGYFFNPLPPGLPPGQMIIPFYRCMGNKWVSQNDRKSILTESTDCVRYQTFVKGSPCPDGSFKQDFGATSICLNCPSGTYADTKTKSCKECTPGFYQDEEGNMGCLPCPKNTFSVAKRAKSVGDCKAVCNPGYYSTIHGVEPCVECPMDTYQDNEQRTQCHACPVGTHTASTGSTSLEDCLSPVRITDIIPSQDYATYENEAISLACYIAGDPTPTVSWEKVGGSLPSMDRLAITNIFDLDGKLAGVEYVISTAVVADSGSYKCTATNKHGSVSKQVRINVQAGSPPGIVPQ